jgi:hypothetical protein
LYSLIPQRFFQAQRVTGSVVVERVVGGGRSLSQCGTSMAEEKYASADPAEAEAAQQRPV